MKFYIAGPMTGLPEYNYPAFEQAKKELTEMGYDVVSPHDIDHGEDEKTRGTGEYTKYIKAGLKVLLECDAIALLPEWAKSKGARIEVQVSQWSGMPTYLYSPGASFPMAHVDIELREHDAVIKVLDGSDEV